MQFKVPQNIDLEDKIVGPLTLTQFIELLLGGVFVYIIFTQSGIASVAFIFLGIPIGLFSLALAFLKINDQPFGQFFLSLLRFIGRPKMFAWHHGGLSARGVIMKPAPKKRLAATAHKHVTKTQLQELAFHLDTRGHALAGERESSLKHASGEGGA